MSTWDILAGIYHPCRRLPGMRVILDSEIRNCRALWSRVPDNPGRILDVGTGAGSSLDLFPAEVTVIAVDASARMLRRARGRRPGLHAVQADACALPFRDGSFQVASAIGLTEYLADVKAFLKEIGRVTGQDGYFLSTLARKNLLNRMRNLLGNRLYLKRTDQWKDDAASAGWKVEAEVASLLQSQQLMRKSRS